MGMVTNHKGRVGTAVSKEPAYRCNIPGMELRSIFQERQARMRFHHILQDKTKSNEIDFLLLLMFRSLLGLQTNYFAYFWNRIYSISNKIEMISIYL